MQGRRSLRPLAGRPLLHVRQRPTRLSGTEPCRAHGWCDRRRLARAGGRARDGLRALALLAVAQRAVALLYRYSTTLTIGCVDRVRYSSSSCSRLVAVTVIVRPR